MRVFCIICLFLLSIGVSALEVYKTVKADGSVVYSDVRTDGAVPVNLSSINTVVVPALNADSTHTTSQYNPVKKRKLEEVKYLVSIHTPAPEQTLRDNLGTVTIGADVLPKKAGKFQLVFDNHIVKAQSKGLFQLENINRGAHTIQVNFLDNSGKILASSQSQTFYLQKTSALIKAN